jgi:hypothetical protein
VLAHGEEYGLRSMVAPFEELSSTLSHLGMDILGVHVVVPFD